MPSQASQPAEDEIAALVAALALVAGGAGPRGEGPGRQVPSRWVSKARLMRQPVRPGPGAWRASSQRW